MTIFFIFFIITYLYYPTKVCAQENIQNLFEEALMETNDGDFLRALNHWNQLLDLSPNDERVLINRGNVLLSLGDAEGAIKDQTLAISLASENPDAYINRGVAEESLHMWEEACKDYTWILERDPGDVTALYNLGNVMGSLGEWSKAELFFRKASFLNKNFVLARSNKALAAYQLGDIELAELELREIIRKYPLFADARAALSALLWKKGSLGEAQSNWIAVVGLDNNYLNRDWLVDQRRWPPKPINDLFSFLSLEFS